MDKYDDNNRNKYIFINKRNFLFFSREFSFRNNMKDRPKKKNKQN